MKLHIAALLLIPMTFTLTGCSDAPEEVVNINSSAELERLVTATVPVGTSATAARQALKQHQGILVSEHLNETFTERKSNAKSIEHSELNFLLCEREIHRRTGEIRLLQVAVVLEEGTVNRFLSGTSTLSVTNPGTSSELPEGTPSGDDSASGDMETA